MNLRNQEIMYLRVSIERLDYMIKQAHYEDVKEILYARKKIYTDELENILAEELI